MQLNAIPKTQTCLNTIGLHYNETRYIQNCMNLNRISKVFKQNTSLVRLPNEDDIFTSVQKKTEKRLWIVLEKLLWIVLEKLIWILVRLPNEDDMTSGRG